MHWAAIINGLLALGIGLDLFTLYLAIAWIHRRRGPSGIPLLPWACYILFSLLYWSNWPQRFASVLVLTIVHCSCQFLIPVGYRSWFDKRHS